MAFPPDHRAFGQQFTTAPLETAPKHAYANERADLVPQHLEDHMGPKPFRKAAYVALIVLLFGASSGWIGGL